MSFATASSGPFVTSSASPHRARDLLFYALYFLVCLGATPFVDLSREASLDPSLTGNFLNQASFVLSALAMMGFLLATHQMFVVRFAVSPILVLTLGWFVLSAVFSLHTGLAGRRVVLAAMTIFLAAALFALPRTKRDFARLLGVGTLAVLVISFAGIYLWPDVAIHQAYDVREPELAGDWRGPFGHKNGAAAIMVTFIFVGYYTSRAWNPMVGRVVMALATVFLYFTNSKASLALVPVAALAGWLVVHSRPPGKILAVLSVPLVLALATIGSVTLPFVKPALEHVMSDPSFTGRNVIWQFAVDQIAKRPVVGHGFQAFWGMPELLYNWTPDQPWGMRATDAHNGYLNLAVMTGLVGMALALCWIVVQPFADLIATERRRIDPALTLMFVQIILFGLYNSFFEFVLFAGGSTLWFLMVVAILGLRLQRRGALSGA